MAVLALVAAACTQDGEPLGEPLVDRDGRTGAATASGEGAATSAERDGAGATGAVEAAGDAGNGGAPGDEADSERAERPTEEPPPAVRVPRTGPEDFQAGMAVLIYGNEEPEHFRDKTARALDALVGLDANALSLVFPVFQEDFRATEVVADPERTPSEDRLRFFVREARERDFSVMLRPVLDEAGLVDDGHWRGSIRPADTAAWFESYGALLSGYASLAAEEGAEILAIGSELTSLQDETDHWLALVDRVREVYDGQLLYAANWDAPFPEISGSLDWYGVDAFYPLEAATAASVDELAAAWEPWLQQYEAAGIDLDRVVFTEIGVRAEEGAHRRPYGWDHGTAADPEGQARYYAAACERLAPELAGLYWWKVDFDFPDRAETVESFSPLGKPAEGTLRDCYARHAGGP